MSWNLEEPGLLRRTARLMNGQLLCGLALASLAVSSVVASVAWLATAALVAAAPFLVVGVLFALGGRENHDPTARTTR